MYEAGEITLDVRHVLMQTTERLLNDVLERADVTLAKQEHIAALLSALPFTTICARPVEAASQDVAHALVLAWCGLISPFVPALNRSWPSYICSSSSSPLHRSEATLLAHLGLDHLIILVMVRPARRGPFAR
jgi:hypothetical protein